MGFLFWGRKKKKESTKVEETKVEEKVVEPEVKKEVPAKGKAEPKTEKKNTTKKETVKKETVSKPVAKKETTKPATKKPVKETKEDSVEEEKPQRKAPTSKVYHVSLRKEDGKWQVKYGGGKKAIKLFDTQAEAIKFAEERADSQDGSISIHKKDGKIRKQDYSKKPEEKKAEDK